jgi:hypothetical protein
MSPLSLRSAPHFDRHLFRPYRPCRHNRLPVPPKLLIMLLYRFLRLYILPLVLLSAFYLFDMSRRLHTRLCLTNSSILDYVLLEPGKNAEQTQAMRVCVAAIGPRRDSRSNDCPRSDACPRKDARPVVSRIRMTDFLVFDPWSRISSVPVTGSSTW